MTKESYIKKVKRKLILPKDLKYAIISDLEETFDSAKEQGETSASVIKRLGSPEDFISDVMENSEFTEKERRFFKKRKYKIYICDMYIFCSGIIINDVVGYNIFNSNENECYWLFKYPNINRSYWRIWIFNPLYFVWYLLDFYNYLLCILSYIIAIQ